jgi:hypothetical protein
VKSIASVAALFVAGLCSAATAQELSQRDQLHAAVQKICPVSGQSVSAMAGEPAKDGVAQGADAA